MSATDSLSQEKEVDFLKTQCIPSVHVHSGMDVTHVDTSLRRATRASGAALFSLCRKEGWLPILDEALRFQKTNSEHYKLLCSSRYVIHLRDVIYRPHSAHLVRGYWKKLLMEVALSRTPYSCDIPVAHNHHSPRPSVICCSFRLTLDTRTGIDEHVL